MQAKYLKNEQLNFNLDQNFVKYIVILSLNLKIMNYIIEINQLELEVIRVIEEIFIF